MEREINPTTTHPKIVRERHAEMDPRVSIEVDAANEPTISAQRQRIDHHVQQCEEEGGRYENASTGAGGRIEVEGYQRRMARS
jgi:hypothetical protein